MSVRRIFKTFSAHYARFVQRQGLAMLSVLCVAVIVGSAVWTKHSAPPTITPTPPVNHAALAAQLWQQSLQEVNTPAPAPSDEPIRWVAPVAQYSILRGFDGARMVQSGVTGIWQLHDAVDLSASRGTPVLAMADGVVKSVAEKGLDRACVTVIHAEGFETTVAGLSMLAAIQPGDPVQAGQTLGFAGQGPLDEADMEDHIHLRITHKGCAVNPLPILTQAN